MSKGRKKKATICRAPIKENQAITPLPPDPTFQVTEFLSWLKKRGAIRKLNECKIKWESEGLDIERIIRELNPHICIYRYKSEKVVKLENKPWADQWMMHYNLEVPHHGQTKEMEKIFSVTETKTKV